MTGNSSSRISEELLREIQKLKIRLDDFLKEEKAFVKELRKCIEKLKDVSNRIEKLRGKPDPKTAEGLAKLRLEAVQALSEALKGESKAQHEKSHLLESYGTLILALQELDYKLKSTI